MRNSTRLRLLHAWPWIAAVGFVAMMVGFVAGALAILVLQVVVG